MWGKILLASSVLSTVFAAGSAQAIDLRTGLGGPAGFGQLAMLPNDDSSSNQLDLPFALNFFGNNYSSFFVNNNGNISFNAAVGAFTPDPFPVSSQPMIAPYWGDVDTRCETCGSVYVAAGRVNLPDSSPNFDSVTVTWNNVGYYSSSSDKTNNFQLTLIDRSGTGAGNFDIEFRYDRLQWTTGSASGGSGGLGGTPAQAGYDAGDDRNFFTLPGSRTNSVLSLAELSNVSSDTNGLWLFNIRGGEIADGSAPDRALTPTVVDPVTGAYLFDFGVELNQRVFIDPLVATGYRYEITGGGLLITSAQFAAALVDSDGYQIYSLDDILLGVVQVGGTFTFADAVAGFVLRGIDPLNMLDPANTAAFVTGLTFNGAGQVQMSQTPIDILDVGGAVPEPATWATMLVGFGLIGAALRRRKTASIAY
jgi:hypothetical protein